MNRALLEDIKRFKLMVNYDSNVTLSENYSKIVLTEKKERKQYCYVSEDGEQTPIGIMEDGNFQPTEFGKKMNIFTLSDLGELNRTPYADGGSKVIQCDGYVPMDSTKVEVDKNKGNDNDLSRRDTRRNKRANDREIKQNIEGANWLGKNSGSLIIGTSEYPSAENAGVSMSYVFVGTSEKFDVKKPAPQPQPEQEPIYDKPTLDKFEVNSNNRVFPDNIVNVDFDKYPTAKEEFDEIVKDFVAYINAGGAKNLTNVTIQGQADSANPTWKAPAGYQIIDHNYGGIRRPNKNKPQTKEELENMNIYLAKSRAHNYAKLLIDTIKEKTGVEISIKELTPISYLGQGESKRGPKYRSMILVANAPELEVTNPADEIKYKERAKEKFDRQKEYQAKYNPVDINIGIDGVTKSFSQSDKTLGPIALSVELPNSNFTNVTKGVYLREDYIAAFKIPEEFGDFVSNASVNGDRFTITDEGGKTNTFEMISFDNSAEFGNVVSIMNTNNEFMDDFMGPSSRRGGKECEGKYGTKNPLTTHTTESIKYNGKNYVRLKNYWFAVIPKKCSKNPRKIDYYKDPKFEKYADEEMQTNMGY